MTSDWLGGGLIVALAAVLWLIYLLPTWFRRNEFLSTERNVVRLQQTLRILAETSEVPDEVHVEANARSVAEQQRILKKANAQNLLAEREGLQTLIEQGIAARAAAEHAAIAESVAPSHHTAPSQTFGDVENTEYETIVLAPTLSPQIVRAASLKLRRARAAASGILLLALVVAVLGGVQIAVNGAWVVLVVGLLAATLCVTRLGRLARDGRALRARATAAGLARGGSGAPQQARRASGGGLRSESVIFADAPGFGDGVPDAAGEPAGSGDAVLAGAAAGAGAGASSSSTSSSDEAGVTGWTPVPLPEPLSVRNRRIHGGLPVAGYVEQTAEQAEQALRAAARDSERALREAQAAADARDTPEAEAAAPAAATVAPVAPPRAAPNRFATMGVVDDADTGAIDVDTVLARRRAG